eukprot:8851456-Pyramimonas_sp.AAC.1
MSGTIASYAKESRKEAVEKCLVESVAACLRLGEDAGPGDVKGVLSSLLAAADNAAGADVSCGVQDDATKALKLIMAAASKYPNELGPTCLHVETALGKVFASIAETTKTEGYVLTNFLNLVDAVNGYAPNYEHEKERINTGAFNVAAYDKLHSTLVFFEKICPQMDDMTSLMQRASSMVSAGKE